MDAVYFFRQFFLLEKNDIIRISNKLFKGINMLVVKILIISLFILFFLLLFILFIPFVYKFQGRGLDEKSISYSLDWFFGLFGYSGCYALNQGLESSINILGFKIKIKEKDKSKKEKAKRIKKKKEKKNKKKALSTEAIQYIMKSMKKILLHLRPDKIEGYGRLGFDDPYYTGMTCLFVESSRGLGWHHLNLDYVFEDEIYEGEIYIEGRIFIVYILYIVIRLLLNRSVRKLIVH